MGEPAYLAWIRRQPCALQPCSCPSEAHHHTRAPTYAPGERPPKAIAGAKRGKSQTAADYYAMPLCTKHHAQLHRGLGFFEGMSDEQVAAFQDQLVVVYRGAWEARAEEEPVFRAGAQALAAPRPTIRQIAQRFCADRSLGPQISFDLQRLLEQLEREGVF